MHNENGRMRFALIKELAKAIYDRKDLMQFEQYRLFTKRKY